MSGKILIVDNVSTNRIVLRVKLSSAFYDVTQAGTAADALAQTTKTMPDLVILSGTLPDLAAPDLCRRLKALDGGQDLQIMVVLAQNDTEERLAVLAAGADEVIVKPLDEDFLLARLRSLIRSGEMAQELRMRDGTDRALGFADSAPEFETPARIGLVTENRSDAVLWKQMLEGTGTHRITSYDPKALLRDLHDGPLPDALVLCLDGDAPENTLRLVSELHSQSATRHIALMAVLQNADRVRAAQALDLGCNDIMLNGINPPELSLRLDALIRRKRTADRLRDSVRTGLRAALIDPLTGLYNRRYAMPHLARLSAQAAETGRDFAVMLADLDHFKRINDTWGHAAGDSVLVEVARRLRDNLRPIDLISRIGGEEFLIAMPDTDRHEARGVARRLCRIIGQEPFGLPGTEAPVPVTISIGVAMSGHPSLDDGAVSRLLDRADRALYGAKTHGRNQVTVSRTAA